LPVDLVGFFPTLQLGRFGGLDDAGSISRPGAAGKENEGEKKRIKTKFIHGSRLKFKG
jgi:hypothetical protein